LPWGLSGGRIRNLRIIKFKKSNNYKKFLHFVYIYITSCLSQVVDIYTSQVVYIYTSQFVHEQERIGEWFKWFLP